MPLASFATVAARIVKMFATRKAFSVCVAPLALAVLCSAVILLPQCVSELGGEGTRLSCFSITPLKAIISSEATAQSNQSSDGAELGDVADDPYNGDPGASDGGSPETEPQFWPMTRKASAKGSGRASSEQEWRRLWDEIPRPPVAQVPPEDKALFDRALVLGAAPPSDTGKIAFLFLTPGPLPLARLWAKFLKGRSQKYSIYIHTSEGYVYPPKSLPFPFRGRQIPSKNVSWGSITMVDAERRLLAHAYMDPNNLRFVLVSESCIPLHSFDVAYAYLMNSRHSHVAVRTTRRTDRWCWTPGMRPLVKQSEWKKGSQWFEMKRELVPIVLRDEKYYLKFGWTYVKIAYPDEHYLPTMLTKLAPGTLANRSVTWVTWPRVKRGVATPHPIAYSKAEVTKKFLRKIRWGTQCLRRRVPGSICYLFARKFLPDTLPVLMKSTTALGY